MEAVTDVTKVFVTFEQGIIFIRIGHWRSRKAGEFLGIVKGAIQGPEQPFL